MECKTELIPRILRDIDDGVLALDKTGRIMYINHQCQELLDLSGEEIGKSYAEVFYGDHSTNKNEDFHQLIINAIYNKDQTHCNSIIFTDTNNKQKYLSIEGLEKYDKLIKSYIAKCNKSLSDDVDVLKEDVANLKAIDH
jgi:transcriptional regulator with PAS, ATPase and Fis domain